MVSKKVICEKSNNTEALTKGLNYESRIENLPTNDAKLIHRSLEAGVIKKNLEEIQSTWPQINWTVIPPAAPHRIGAAESMVKATKRSLCYLPTSTLTILEFDAVLKNIASTINNRPLGFNTTEDQVLTPNQLLLGRNYDPILPPDSMREANITVLHSSLRNIVSSWFKQWNNTVVPQLFKRSK